MNSPARPAPQEPWPEPPRVGSATRARRLDAAATFIHLGLPVGLGAALAALALREAGAAASRPGLLALLSGILLAYLHDRLGEARRRADRRDSPGRTGALERSLGPLRWLAGLAAAGVALALALEPTRLALPVALLAVTALSYPWLSQIPLGKTVAAAACWTGGCLVLPLATTAAPQLAPAASLFLILASGCVLCDLKDPGDRDAGRLSLPALWGDGASRGAAAALGIAGALLGAVTGPKGLGLAGLVAGLGLVVLAARPGLLRRELAGPIAVDGWLLASALLALAAGRPV